MSDIRVKRIYEPASEDDGTRVLVDRLGHAACARKMQNCRYG